MIVKPKTPQNKTHRTKTPLKAISSLLNSPQRSKKPTNHESAYRSVQINKQKPSAKQATKYKSRHSYLIIQTLQSIYNDLNFTNYETFPIQRLAKAKHNIDDLLTYLGDRVLCRYHQDELNLYCEHDKRPICVSCVYKNPEHKNHKIKALQSVQKVINLELIRNEQKVTAMVDHLRQTKEDIEEMNKQISQSVMTINQYTFSIIDQSIKELTAIRTDMEKKVSLSFNRTRTVINRYSHSIEILINHLEKSMQKATSMNPLSKYMLLKELTTEQQLIEQLTSKFMQNKQLMEQWNQSNKQFEKLVLRKRNIISETADIIKVTEF